MKPSTERAFELLRAGTSTPLPRDREQRMRGNIEAAVGVALPAAISAPSAITAVKALTATKAALPASLASLGKTVVITLVSMAVGSAATVAVKHALNTRASTVTQPRTSPPPVTLPAAHQKVVAVEVAEATDVEVAAEPSLGEPATNPEPTLAELPPPPSPLPQAAVVAAMTVPKQVRPVAAVVEVPQTPNLPRTSPSGGAALPAAEVAPFSEPPLVVAEADKDRARCSEASERQALTEARHAFDVALPAEALALLDHQHQQCPTGEWSPTSWRLRIKTLCVLNRTAEAKGLMYWYWGEHAQEARLAQAELGDSCPASVLLPPPTAPRQLE